MDNEKKEIKFEEITGEVWKPEQENDSVEGVLVAKEADKPPYNSLMYHLEKDGKAIAVWGCTILDSRMVYIEIGQYVKITYKGENEAKPGRNALKIFKVERGKIE